eukprot:scaffold596191_cov38-Prasinocladus_malaysianus.AAC.1
MRANEQLMTAVIKHAVTHAEADPLELQRAIVSTITNPNSQAGAPRVVELSVKDVTDAAELGSFYEIVLVANLAQDEHVLQNLHDVAKRNGAEVQLLEAAS